MWEGNNLIRIYSFFQQVFSEHLLSARNSLGTVANIYEECGQKSMPSRSTDSSEADTGDKQNKAYIL